MKKRREREWGREGGGSGEEKGEGVGKGQTWRATQRRLSLLVAPMAAEAGNTHTGKGEKLKAYTIVASESHTGGGGRGNAVKRTERARVLISSE